MLIVGIHGKVKVKPGFVKIRIISLKESSFRVSVPESSEEAVRMEPPSYEENTVDSVLCTCHRHLICDVFELMWFKKCGSSQHLP